MNQYNTSPRPTDLAPEGTASMPAIPDERINILIVDDEPKNLSVLQTLLDDPSYRLVRAESADQALLALVVEEFALLILDIRMPGMSGFELAQMIKERKKTARVPIIFLSAYYNEDQHVLEGYSTGAVDYLHKPVNPIILRSKVAVFAELHRKNLESVKTSQALLAEITERRRADEKLRELNENLEQHVAERTEALRDSEARLATALTSAEAATSAAERANRAKDHFLAVLSHELRTPLAPVRMAISIWERSTESLPPEFLADLAMIRRNVDLECRLIDDLLDLNRIIRGKLELQFAPVDLHEEIRHALRTVEGDAAAKQVMLSFDPGPLDAGVVADATRIQQVLWNLLKNAVKFTPTGGSVVVRTYGEPDDHICIEVRDTGAGIDPNDIEQIFNAFEQGGVDVTRQFGGMGLGLTISRALATMHGGRLTAQSEGRGRGAIFTLELAVAPSSERAAVDTVSPGTSELGLSPISRKEILQILIVEDHIDTAKLLTRVLKSLGYEVQTTGTIAEALSVAESRAFDLIISDLGLPDGSGYDLMRQIVARRPTKAIALSGYGMEEDVQLGRDAGFAVHLTKPVNFEQLEQCIQNLLRNGAAATG